VPRVHQLLLIGRETRTLARMKKRMNRSDSESMSNGILLTPYSRVLLEKLIGSQLVKKISHILWNPNVRYRTHKSPMSNGNWSFIYRWIEFSVYDNLIY